MDITLENYTEITGRRFRVSNDQKNRIEAGELTREEAFQEFINNGGLERNKRSEAPSIPDEVFERSDLTLDNFPEITKEITGQARRFRVSSEQSVRIRNGEITREQAFAEYVEQRRNAANEVVNEVTEEVNQ